MIHKRKVFALLCAIIVLGMCACGKSVNGQDIADELNSNEDLSSLLTSGSFVYRDDLSDTDTIVIEFSDEGMEMEISDGVNTISEITGTLGLDKKYAENTGKPISLGNEKELWDLIIDYFELLSKQYSDQTEKNIRIIVTDSKDEEEFEVLAVENGVVVVNEYEELM